MENFEEELNKKLSHIRPSRDVFDQVVNQHVTNKGDNRYTNMKADELSYYQLINNFFMKKGLLVGLPIALVLVVVGVFAFRSPSQILPIVNNENNLISDNTSQKNVVEDNSSVDSILANFDNDINADLMSNQEEDKNIDSIMAELRDINNLKTSSYEDTI